MKALLEHSQKNYGPLPSRIRTYSRPSPYPVRTIKRSLTPDELCPDLVDVNMTTRSIQQPLQSKPINVMKSALAIGNKKPLDVEFDKSKGENGGRVPSTARRGAQGGTKRGSGKSSDLKENAGNGTLTT